MGYFVFSYVGFIYLLRLTIPNLIWIKNQHQHHEYKNKILLF